MDRAPDRAADRLPRAASIVPVAVALATFLAFSGALRNHFVNWDDPSNIPLNPHLRDLSWTNLRWMFTPTATVTFSPLVWLLFSLVRAVGGLNDPLGFHLAGVLVHVAVATVLCLTLVRLLRTDAPGRDGGGETVSRCSAGLAALLFALHPLRVEAVAWASAQHHALAALFFLASIWTYLLSRDAPDAAPARGRWRAASLLCYVLSLLSGPMGVTLPAALLVLDAYRRQGRPGGHGTFAARASARDKAPFFLLAVLAGLATLRGRVASGHLSPIAKHGLADRIAQASFGLAFYLWKTLAPLRLSPLYPLPDKIDPLAGRFLLSGALAVSVTVGAFALRRRFPALLAAWTYYVVTLTPVLGFAQFGPQIAADRYTYLPSLGSAALSAGILTWIWKKKGPRAWTGAAVLALVLLAAMSALTCRQMSAWRDSETLWRHALSIDPDLAGAHADLGDALYQRGKVDEAIGHYQAALRSDPGLAGVHNQLGYALAGQGKTDEAIVQYRLALQARPDMGSANNNLALALAGQGKAGEAIVHFESALKERPDQASTHYHLGVALTDQGRLEEAIAHFREALRIKPDYPQARDRLDLALRRVGRLRKTASPAAGSRRN